MNSISYYSLQDFLHVPDLEYSLIYVSTIDKKGLLTTFGNVGCRIFKGCRDILTGILIGSLCILGQRATKYHRRRACWVTRPLHEWQSYINENGLAEIANGKKACYFRIAHDVCIIRIEMYVMHSQQSPLVTRSPPEVYSAFLSSA